MSRGYTLLRTAIGDMMLEPRALGQDGTGRVVVRQTRVMLCLAGGAVFCRQQKPSRALDVRTRVTLVM